jgi:micrococcal nuclease
MKKVLFFILLFFICINVEAKTITVKYKSCSDGDTAHFKYDNIEIKARFLGINTPELEHDDITYQYYANEAKEYTCKKLENAKTIKLEYDDKAGETDKYNRHLVWVWIDNKLLNEELVYNGYAEVKYLYDDYKYKDELLKAEEHAKNNKIGIWNNNSNITSNSTSNNTSNSNDIVDEIIHDENGNINYIVVGIIIIILIILMFTSKTVRNSIFRYIDRL